MPTPVIDLPPNQYIPNTFSATITYCKCHEGKSIWTSTLQLPGVHTKYVLQKKRRRRHRRRVRRGRRRKRKVRTFSLLTGSTDMRGLKGYFVRRPHAYEYNVPGHFEREVRHSTLAAGWSIQADITVLPPSTPAILIHFLNKSLKKLPRS